MRLVHDIVTSLLFSHLIVLTHAAVTSSPSYGAGSSTGLDRHPSRLIRPKSWPSRCRDTVIRALWPSPPNRPSSIAVAKGPILPTAPPSVQARYGGDVVLRFKITSEEEARALSEAVNILFLDVWEFTRDWADIRLSKDVVPSLLNLLPATLHRAHTPLMHDLAQTIFESYPSPALIDRADPSPLPSRPFSPQLRQAPEENNIFFRDYQPLSVILPWMRLLRSLFPTHVRLLNVGISYEGREIPALRVGVHPTNSELPIERRKTILVVGGSHAREWISTSTVNYVAYSFITAYGRDRDITQLLEKFDFVFVPTLNPDGYAYTWDNDRLWRKNRQQTPLRFCQGLDIDRAYGFQWDSSARANENPCSESFSGERPFEAIETRRFADWVKNETVNNHVDIVGFLDLHSYSQQILYPYSYSCMSTPPNLETLEELAIGLAKAIRLTHKERYDITPACEASTILDDDESEEDHHPKSSNKRVKQRSQRQSPLRTRIESGGGSALDWFHHEMKVPYTYQIKLRDTGNYGFLLPKESIVPTGKEIFKAVEYFARFLDSNKGIEDHEGNGETNSSGKGVSDDAKLSLPEKLGEAMASEVVHEDKPVEQEEDEQVEEGDLQEVQNVELRRKRR